MVGHLDVLDADGVPVVADEVPAAPGLRFIGFLSRPGLIGYVAGKSKRVAKSIVRELNSQPSEDSSQAVPGLCSEEVIT
jgi:hypothetical protein